MIFNQQWTGYRITDGIRDGGFFARVPGNIQYDYAVSHNFADVMYNDGCRQFEALENDTWEYRAPLQFERKDGERVFFVSHGIDYKYEIDVDGEILAAGEGAFTPVCLDVTKFSGKKVRQVKKLRVFEKRNAKEMIFHLTKAEKYYIIYIIMF